VRSDFGASGILARPSQASLAKIAATSFIGTAIEWYDFFIYGNAAALIFGPIFFPSLSPLAGSLAAFSTFTVGFLSRPLGGVVIGHFGDRIGRKSMLVTSLMIMGVATFLIGLLPTYAQIGVWAPILLVVLRFIQGLGVGGEWGGAVLMAVEHAPNHRRGFYGSFPQMGVPAGIILSNLVFLFLGQLLSRAQFASWGWRVPFLLSSALVAIGLYARLQLEESQLFKQAKRAERHSGMPIALLLRCHWRRVLLASLAFMASTTVGYIVLVYVLSYGTTTLGMSRSTVLLMVLTASCVQLVMTPALSALSDRLGRRSMFMTGAIASALWTVPFFLLVDTRDPWLMLLSMSVAVTFVSAMYGPQGAIAAELFPTSLRYSGASLSCQISSILGGGLAPTVAVALFSATGTSLSTALYVGGVCVVSLIAIALAPETYRASLDTEEGAPAVVSARQQHRR
jgi:metabolite-proton symporter